MTRYAVALALWLAACACGVAVARAQPVPPLSACVQAAQPQYASLQAGRHIVFVCTDAVGAKAYPNGISCLHSVCDPGAFVASVLRVASAQDKKQAVDAEWGANIRWTYDAPPNDPAKALCAERRAWIRANWATWTKDFKPTMGSIKP